MRVKHITVLLSILFTLTSASIGSQRLKRMAFNFANNNGASNDGIDWEDDSAKAPTLNDPPPDLSPWNVHVNDDSEIKPAAVKINAESSIQSTPPSAFSSTTLHYHYDCRPSKNFCLLVSPCNKNLQYCAMDLKCINYVCVDKISPEPTTVMNFNGVPDINHTSPLTVNTAVNLSTSEPYTLTTGRSRKCPGSSYLCVHGYCKQKKWHSGGISLKCLCDKGWIGDKCDEPCTIDCIHGNCMVIKPQGVYLPPENITDQHMKCNCQSGWQGTFCQEEIPDIAKEAAERIRTIVFSLGAALIFVIVVSSIVLVMLWRKRVIFVMKLVYFFKMEIKDDGRFYDAYISMGTSCRGIDFVKNKLCPKLQDSGFNVYVQARDQLAGEVMVESIHKVMEQSRRTILIITPEYLQNEWSKFECVIAQIETLKLHQRIIPIVLEDISEEKQNMNKTLKHILASVKCLKFPTVKSSETESLKEKKRKEERFWKRLRLTMPKKQKTAVEEPRTETSDLEDIVVARDARPIDISSVDVMYSAV